MCLDFIRPLSASELSVILYQSATSGQMQPAAVKTELVDSLEHAGYFTCDSRFKIQKLW